MGNPRKFLRFSSHSTAPQDNQSNNNYASHMLEVSVAQICLTMGWQKAKPTALHYLACLLERYVRKIAYLTMRTAELNNRTVANMEDVGFAFAYLQIDMDQMAEYYREVPENPLPYEVPYVTIPNSGCTAVLPKFTLPGENLGRKRKLKTKPIEKAIQKH